MTRKIYRTNKGKPLDMEALRIANEKIVAVGNMSVNAKGDIVQGGKVVKSAKDRVAPSYQSTTQVKQVSLKKPLTSTDTTVAPKEKPPLPEMDTSEMTTETVKTRDDGSHYAEIMTPEGDIEIKDIKPKAKRKTKPTKKKPSA